MKKRLLTLLISSLFTLSSQAQVEGSNASSHASFKNNLDVLQQDFYRGLRFEDWTASGLTEADINVGALDTSHQAAFRYLETNSNIDNNRIGVLGSSGSGPALLEFALKQPKLKAVVARCSLVDGPLRNDKLLASIPSMSVDALITRLGGDPGDKVYYAKNTHKDPVAMPEDVKSTAALSSQGKAVFFGKAGHCPEGKEASNYIVNFLTQNI